MKIYGYDLDGVLCQDVEAHAFTGEHRSAVLLARQLMKPFFIPPHNVFLIITARPFCDMERTLEWCSRYFKHRYKLEHNLGDVLNVEDSAQFKAEAIMRFGVTDYIESCPLIAHRLHELCGDVARIEHFKPGLQF